MSVTTTRNPDDRPDAYKQGWLRFCGLIFKVSPDVLIPRFETEQLVKETVLHVSKNLDALDANTPLTLLDVGTGSGCISIALAKALPQAHILATDISPQALEIAQENAKTHQVEKHITFIQMDLLSDFTDKVDIIVANLPYVPTHRLATLDASVKDFEPLVALDGGSDGFDMYRKLFKQIVQNQIAPKAIIVEIDDTHKKVALDETRFFFPQAKVEIKQDISNMDRVLIVKLSETN